MLRKVVEKTITIASDATFADLYQLSFADWCGMPTIHSGHFDNLKFESAEFRVWVSRAILADYDGDSEAYSNDRLTIEQFVGGVWRCLDRYGRLVPK